TSTTSESRPSRGDRRITSSGGGRSGRQDLPVMRAIHLVIAAAVGVWTSLSGTGSAGAVCSVFDRHPCTPTVCSVFQRRPCVPEFLPPIGQDLRLTIETAGETPADNPQARESEDGPTPGSERKVDTIRQLFATLRSCWFP